MNGAMYRKDWDHSSKLYYPDNDQRAWHSAWRRSKVLTVPWDPGRWTLTHQLQQLIQSFTEDSKSLLTGKGL